MDSQDMNPFYLGQLVWRHRKAKNESYQSLAHRTGSSISWIRRLEHGWCENPDPKLLRRVATALEIDPVSIDRLNSGSVLGDPRSERVYFRSHHYIDQDQLNEIQVAFRLIQALPDSDEQSAPTAGVAR